MVTCAFLVTLLSIQHFGIAIRMANKDDTVMVDAAVKSLDAGDVDDLLQTNHSDAFTFTETEKLALELYDQLQELELQRSLLQAQQTGTLYFCTNSYLKSLRANVTIAHVADVSPISDDDLQEQLIVAEREAMEAKAEYEMRNKIIHNVLVTDPMLKAVHGGEKTGFAEK